MRFGRSQPKSSGDADASLVAAAASGVAQLGLTSLAVPATLTSRGQHSSSSSSRSSEAGTSGSHPPLIRGRQDRGGRAKQRFSQNSDELEEQLQTVEGFRDSNELTVDADQQINGSTGGRQRQFSVSSSGRPPHRPLSQQLTATAQQREQSLRRQAPRASWQPGGSTMDRNEAGSGGANLRRN